MSRATAITRAWLKRHPLPRHAGSADKDERGRVLVVGGSREVPGAILLAGVAALRAGAGKLQLATVSSAAIALGIAVPEALVVALREDRKGEIAGGSGALRLRAKASQVDALVLGPGMSGSSSLLGGLVGSLSENAVLVVDAAAIFALIRNESLLHPLGGRAVITPHAGEMATLLGIDRRDVEDDAAEVARVAAERFGAVVALKGSVSWIAEPGGRLLRYDEGTVGLATSGSGDTLAGIVGGLAARGADATTAASWAVFLHGAAGRALSRRVGRVGFLARELLAEVPAAMLSFR